MKFLIPLIIVLQISILNGQQVSDTIPLTAQNQFDLLIKKSGRYKEYRVIKTKEIHTLKNRIIDSLVSNRKEIKSLHEDVAQHKLTITDLESKLDSNIKQLNEVKAIKDEMSFLGISMSKFTYNILLCSLIVLLTLGIVFFYSQYKRSNRITVETKEKYSELENEYENHRKVSLEREQKVRRQLQDELNKHKKA